MIDAVNFVDIIIVYQYWDNKIRVYRALSKTSGNPATKPKEKGKRTRWEVSSYRHHNWSTVELRRLFPIKMLGTCKVWNQFNFLVSLFHVVSNEDSIYHYPHCPIGLDSWCKYNAGRANLQTSKLINLGQVFFQKTLFVK